MSYRILHRPWRARKVYYYLMLPELGLLVALLVLFGLVQSSTFRKTLWEIGFENGFNSNPNMILYAYANHQPLPKIPFVWSVSLTNYNVAISVISLFFLLAKLIALIMHLFYPIIGAAESLILVALYIASAYGQAGPDYADSRYPSRVAWYIGKSCDYARPHSAFTDCTMAKAGFAVTIVTLVLYVVQLGFAIVALLPNKQLDVEDDATDSDDGVPVKQWEMQPQPALSSHGGPLSPRGAPDPMVANAYSGGISDSPFTPRTQAFHALDRKLPLRG